jgi:SOS-response transcriptional repressor LexA
MMKKEKKCELGKNIYIYIAGLKAGDIVKFRPKGNSMTGIIESGQLVTVRPITSSEPLEPGNVVLCKVNGKDYLHLITNRAYDGREMFLIGNNRGRTNGWIARKNIFGKLVSVEP